MVAAVKARLTNDGTLLTVGEFDETLEVRDWVTDELSPHIITADNIFHD